MPTRRRFLGTVPGALALAGCRGRNSLARATPGGDVVHVAERVRFAVIGDFGLEGQAAADVAAQIRAWQPDFIITVGDNNYPDGDAATIDANVGRYYHDFIAPYHGAHGAGADINRFFPALGNHDWRNADLGAHFDYFQLPGNERYYDLRWGPVHLFCVDSDEHEPDGITADSVQAQWLRDALAKSPAPFRVVYFHHPPYSSGDHGSDERLRWPFFAWGASLVLAGHDHIYERIEAEGGVYVVNGLGGHEHRYDFGEPIAGSVVRFQSDWGALRIDADEHRMEVVFETRHGREIDRVSIEPHAGVSVTAAAHRDDEPAAAE